MKFSQVGRVIAALVVGLVVGCASADPPPGAETDAGMQPPIDAALLDAAPSIDDSGSPPAGDSGTTPTTDARPSTPDAGATCSPCELVSQCGCEGRGEAACDLRSSNPSQGTTECRPVLANGTTTSTCTDSTGCAAGYVCMGTSGGASCKRYCNADDGCQGGGGVCAIEVTAGGTPIPGVKVCSPDCSPFTASGCPSSWACAAYSDPGENKNFTWCFVPGTGTNNALCSDDSSCASGYTCLNVNGTPRCKKYCDRGDGNPGCTSLQQCAGLVDSQGAPLVIGGVSYGVCI